ncbi:MAG: class I SAM-dependent methyltransferase [Nanoarchaeota archaeon]
MKIENQQEVWDNIAEEWHEFKKNPGRGVEEFLDDKKGKILDLGSGSGRNLVKNDNLSWHLVDFSEKMLKLAEKKAEKEKIKIKTFQADLTKLPFEDNFFDLGISIASIHCLNPKNHKKAISELFRVLKKGSEVFVAVWNKNSIRFKNSPREKYVKWRDKGARYYYLFEEKEIHNLFKKAGFKIKKKIESEVNISFVAKK